MTLALAIIACLACAAVASLWAARSAPRWRRVQVLVAVLAPLVAFLAIVRASATREVSQGMRVTGQYAPLADTVMVGGSAADVRLPVAAAGGAGAAGTQLRLWYDHAARAVRLRVDSGVALVALAGRPVNAVPLGSGTRVTLDGSAALEIRSSLPAWPAGCLLRVERLCAERVLTVSGGGDVRSLTVRPGTTGIAAAALADPRLARVPFVFVSIGGRVHLTASPTGPVRVNGEAVPAVAEADAGSIGDGPELRVGAGIAPARMRVEPDTIGNRLDLHFLGRTRGERWPLPVGAGRSVHRVVASVPAGTGALRLLDLDAAAPLGARARGYQGALEWTGRAFRWHADGRVRTLRSGVTERLPGTRAPALERGHLIRLGAEAAPAGAVPALALVWAAGALLLALGTDTRAAGGALRVAVLGLVYTLALMRVTLAYRVAAAPPNNAEALPWAAVFLVAFPLLVFLLERWMRVGGSSVAVERSPRRERWRLDRLMPAAGRAVRRARTAGALPGTGAAVLLLVALIVAARPLGLGGGHFALGTVVIVTGTWGLAQLQRMLVAPGAAAAIGASPIGMLLPRSERGFAAPHVWRAFTTLLVVVGLYVALAWSIRGVPSPVLAVVYAAGVGLAYAFVWARERVRPRMPMWWLAWRALGAGAGAGAGVFLASSVVRPTAGVGLPLALGLGAGAIAAAAFAVALLPRVRSLRGWPYRRVDVLPSRRFAALPIGLILVAGLFGLRRVAITLGFALAVAMLLLVAQVFAAWWHRETGRRVREELGESPERASLGLLLGPLAVALVVYLAYGAVDRGLLMLLLVAVLLSTIVAAATIGRAALASAIVVGTLVVGVAIPRAISVDPATLAVRPVALNTPRIRSAAISAPEALSHQLALSREETGREIVNTLQQDWGMRAYAASGGTSGRGLFASDFSAAAITEEVALTDNAFTVFVLGEHGFVGGVAVLGAYVALALTLLGAAREAARRVGTAHLALPLAGIAAYLAVPALYMAAANVDLLPLTGQNFPLLGLRSGADVAFIAWLTALAVIALPAPVASADDGQEREGVRRGDLRRVRVTLGIGAAVVTGAALAVGTATWRATHAEVTPFALDVFADDLRTLLARGDLVRRGDSLAVAAGSLGKAGLREGDLVRALVQRSNALARGTAQTRRHCLERGAWFTWTGDADVRVSESSCRLGGTKAGERWRGLLTAGATARPLLLTGLAAPVVLADGAAPAAALGCVGAAGDTVRAASVEVTCRTDGAAVQIRGGARPTVRLTAPGTATLDGVPLGTAAVPLAPGGVLALDGTTTVVVDSLPGGALAFARWRNGAVERVSAAGAPPLVGALDSVLARALVTSRTGETGGVTLTLDVPMSRAVGERLAERCAALGTAGKGAAPVVRRCSAIVVDPTTGDVIALASWERAGLPRGAYAPVDVNFRAHRPGSVIKPIFASAVLARYPSLASLVVAQPADTFSAAAGWPLGGRPLKTARNGCTDARISWHCFLPNSNNRFAVTLGLLGLAVEPPSGALPALGGAADGPPTWVDGEPLTERVRLPEPSAARPAAWLASPLARGMTSLFGVRAGRQAVGAFDASLWRAASDSGLLRLGPSWQRVSPTLPELPLDDPAFRDLRHVAGFLIGETDNQWSNAALARAVSRLATGRAVELRLLRGIGDVTLPAAAFDTLPFGTGREAVLEGMRGVVRGQGTARDVAAAFPSPALDLLGKTGTLTSDALLPMSAFLWAGRARGAGLCPAAGIVVVELEPGAAERLRASQLFVDAVGPSLREQFGWGTTSCKRSR